MTSVNNLRNVTISNEEQLWLMAQVKEGKMTIDGAVSWTENRETQLRSMVEDDIIINKDKNLSAKKQTFSASRKFKSFLHRKSTKPIIEPRRKLSYPSESGSDTLLSNDLKNKQIYNFSVYRCGKHKAPQKRILQIDFDANCLSLIHHGNIVKTFAFSSLVSVDGQEGKTVFIHLDDSQELEINAENLADKTKLIRLLNIISEQNEHEEMGQPFDPCDKLQKSFKVIKEGYLEKKGGFSASQWHKISVLSQVVDVLVKFQHKINQILNVLPPGFDMIRSLGFRPLSVENSTDLAVLPIARLVIIRSGELAYYRVDEEELSAALNIIHLSPGSVAVSAEDSNTFTVATTKESHRFRLPDSAGSFPEGIRDEWIKAIQEGCSRHYQDEQEAEEQREDVSSAYLNEEDGDTKSSFKIIFNEIEKLKKGLISSGNDDQYVTDQVQEFVFLLKELQDKDAYKINTVGQLPNGKLSSVKQLNSSNRNTRSLKSSSACSDLTSNTFGSDKTASLGYVQPEPYADVVNVRVSVESVYDVPVSSVDYAVLAENENAYDMAEESTSFLLAKRKSNQCFDYDSSDDEKVTTFSWTMPTLPEKSPPPVEDLEVLPPPPPELCNGDLPPQTLSNDMQSNEVIPDNVDSVYEFVPSDPPPHEKGNGVMNHSNMKTPIIGNGILLSQETSKSIPINANEMQRIPPPVAPRPPRKSSSSTTSFSGTISPHPNGTPPFPTAFNLSPEAATPLPGLVPPPPPGPVSQVPPPPPPGVPPPPPMGIPPPSEISQPTSKRGKSSGKTALRPFHWVPVPKQMISKSMWKNLPDVSGSIRMEDLVEMFRTTDKKQEQAGDDTPKSNAMGRAEPKKKKQYKSYLDQKTAQNLGIFLSGFKLRGEELIKKLSIVNESFGGISTEYIISLRKYAPEPELKSLYAPHAGRENEELAKEDRFLAELCRIPRLGIRLETLQIIRELPNEIQSLKPEVDLVLNACLELLRSKKFETFLQYMLAVANTINSTNSKGTTKGIRLSTLSKASIMRTNDRKFTLLHIVVRILKQTDPDTLRLQEELSSVAKSQTYSIKGLLAEIDIMKKNCFKTKKNCELMRRKKNQPSKEDLTFCSDIENELSKVESSIGKMNEKCVEIRQTLSKVLVKFGESPDTDSQELFGWVRDFIDEYRKCIA